MDEFDAILGGAEAILAFEGPFTTNRNPECGNLTSAQFLVAWQNAASVEAFHHAGGRFTDQRDSNGRTAGEALAQRVKDVAHATPDKTPEVQAVLEAYNKAVLAQGGLVHIEEKMFWPSPRP